MYDKLKEITEKIEKINIQHRKMLLLLRKHFYLLLFIPVKIKIFLNHNEKNKLKAKFIKCMRINASHCQYSIK